MGALVSTGYSTSTFDSRTSGAKTNCIPDELYPPYWSNPSVLYTDSKGQTASGMGIGSVDVERLCECVKSPTPPTTGSGMGYVQEQSSPNTQPRIDACWTAFFRQTMISGGVLGDRNVALYRVPEADRRSFSEFYKAQNFPNPCHGFPAKCSMVRNYESNYYAKRGQAYPMFWAEREPLNHPVHPVDSQPPDPYQNSFDQWGKLRAGIEDFSTGGSQNVTYLKSLKAQREKERLAHPLMGLGAAESTAPDDVIRKQNLIIAGTVVTALGLGAAVYVLTKKK